MASKKEIYALATEIMDAHEIEGEAREELNKLLEPKAGGKSFDITEVTQMDEDGTIIRSKTYSCVSQYVRLVPSISYA